MTLRLACVSADKFGNAIIQQLERSHPVEVVLHIGNRGNDLKGSSLNRGSAVRGTEGHLFDEDQFNATTGLTLSEPRWTAWREEVIEHLQRSNAASRYKSNKFTGVHEYQDYYFILLDAVIGRLRAAKVDAVLFFDIPHLVYDNLVYQAAALLGIRTVTLFNALFPNRFYSVADVQDYGAVPARSTPGANARAYDIKTQELDLFYMRKHLGDNETPKGKMSARATGHLFLYLLLREPRAFLAPRRLFELWERIRSVRAAFPVWRDPFARFFHTSELAYFEHLVQFEKTQVNLQEKFVYFPLHLQPEMTTSALGGVYRDQALAIEHLAARLPEGVKIYVKENPKQGGHGRGPLFFHRLRRIKSVVFLPSDADTHALTRHALAVATISGTAGWEALTAGIPVILFGRSWYAGFPGVTQFGDGFTLSDLVLPQEDALQDALDLMLAGSHVGVISRHYARAQAEFDLALNQDRVAKTIYELLTGTTGFTFGVSGAT